MRTPLNKAMTPSNKTKKEYSNKDLQKVAEAVTQISGIDPEKRRSYQEGLEKARRDYEQASKRKDEAETEKELEQVIDAERYARDKADFFKKRLDIMDFTPRIPEDEYDGHIKAIDGVMQKAAADFKDKARKTMEMLVEARDSYFQLAEEVDNILEDLDRASNVLQSKYRYKRTDFQGMDPVYQENPYDWEHHRVRYAACVNGTVKGTDMILLADPEDRKDGYPWDSTVCVALRAAEKIKKKM